MSGHSRKKEAFSRVGIDAQLKDVGWNLTDGQSVRYEYQLSVGVFADHISSDCQGRAMAVVEAKRAAVNLQEVADQGRADTKQFEVITGTQNPGCSCSSTMRTVSGCRRNGRFRR